MSQSYYSCTKAGHHWEKYPLNPSVRLYVGHLIKSCQANVYLGWVHHKVCHRHLISFIHYNWSVSQHVRALSGARGIWDSPNRDFLITTVWRTSSTWLMLLIKFWITFGYYARLIILNHWQCPPGMRRKCKMGLHWLKSSLRRTRGEHLLSKQGHNVTAGYSQGYEVLQAPMRFMDTPCLSFVFEQWL